VQGSPILCDRFQRLPIPPKDGHRLQRVSDRNVVAVHDHAGNQEVMRPIGQRLQLETITDFLVLEAVYTELSFRGRNRQARHKYTGGVIILTKQLIATTSTPSMQAIALTAASIACATFNVSTGPRASTSLDRLFPASNKRILPADGSTSSRSKTIVPVAKYVILFPSTVRSTTDTETTSSSGSHAYELRSNKHDH
jgi:hypothetical protein